VYQRILARYLRGAKASTLVLGPRQVGKSTLLRALDPDLVVDLASPATYRDYITHPEQLEAELRAVPATVRTVLVDEVQRVPALLDVVQVFTDLLPRRFRFLLSGSSARKLRRGSANLLPGRIHVHQLHPLLACEIGDDFSLDRALAHGTLPGVWTEPDPDERSQTLRSYADTYLREEVQAEALVRDVGGYSRLLDLVAASSGRVLNIAALCREAGLRHETARKYIEVLEDTLVAFRVPSWSGSDRASLVAHPKLFLFDLGVRNALLRRPLDRPLPDERGYLLEHLVAFELYRRTGTIWPEAKLFHFRTRAGAEVDFVVEVGRELWAIEVKASRDAGNMRGLASFANRVSRVSRKIVVFLGDRAQRRADVEVLPLATFLSELPN
jgi:predicted AAA+ superfamily ATPase